MRNRILIIEDDAGVVRLLKRRLAQFGYDDVDVLIGVDDITAPGGILKGFNHSGDVEVDLARVAVAFVDGILAGTHYGWEIVPTLLEREEDTGRKPPTVIAISGTFRNAIEQGAGDMQRTIGIQQDIVSLGRS